ncbi:MAG: spore coat protein [Candidatus Raymondbacteria bacterium RifOxyA12_full_50_37]|uniref:Spore coat protein n=1 Tax=Candidatus Raymondbacteria bacterium RIFOXYD12_FULL_49_13 TaxID=1817890 RepID=A0A1F7FKS0_UNCRA|nr:MAG: spore coat protein [Candidatus Raymondbacteria bacterium RifOxyA12_full_50_37]OGJ94566.1 MAG: spore coat protein [Candidatus Raymondbacteria bacterium RIFOXYA2_FULL_49_16]OGK01715.1 MAG: spore coat protein [Candidatus Raymondbacteria bacterium RifOxyB12_full_50_8]OGK07042.1 MAG: spore coat protein [Candidatus Raymondbacteria bacterium RIFOXYD12_FULL_49_13]OGP45515.1 MAG: spore coat protein [Candidatus Raymondbacteria bacterium RIFOXYB2_FULL_49_35]
MPLSATVGARLAIDGGQKVKTTPYGIGKRFGDEELLQVKEALEQNTLFYYKGKKVKEFTAKFARIYGFKNCIATNSGSASIHVALSALGVSVGDEVIVSPLTDIGSVIGILFQNAIPVFADIHPHNYTMDPASIEARITARTKAILAVQIMGGPCDMDALVQISRKHNIPLVEDCAQAFGAYYKGKRLGGFGVFGCFSTNDFKHMSTGDGGMVVTADDALAQKAFEIADKNYYRSGTHVGKSAKFLAPNYRMTELQGAVGIAQLDKLESICQRRTKLGDMLSSLLQDTPGILPYEVTAGGTSTYMLYLARIKPEELRVDLDTFIKAMNAEGVPGGRYLMTPVYQYDLFQTRTIYQNTHFPLEGTGKSYFYEKGLCPVAEEVISTNLSFPLNEFFTKTDIEETACAIKKVAEAYAK